MLALQNISAFAIKTCQVQQALRIVGRVHRVRVGRMRSRARPNGRSCFTIFRCVLAADTPCVVNSGLRRGGTARSHDRDAEPGLKCRNTKRQCRVLTLNADGKRSVV